MKDRVTLADLTALHAPIRADLIQVFKDVLDEGRFVLGPRVEALERAVAERVTSSIRVSTRAIRPVNCEPGKASAVALIGVPDWTRDR